MSRIFKGNMRKDLARSFYSTSISGDMRLLNKSSNPAGIYLLKVNNRNTRTRCEICSKLTIKIPELRQWRRSGISIVNFEHISHLVCHFNFEHVITGWGALSEWKYTYYKCYLANNNMAIPWKAILSRVIRVGENPLEWKSV